MLTGISTGFDPTIPCIKAMPMIAEVGFDAVSLSWEPSHIDYKTPQGQTQIRQTAEKHGLHIESIHAPWRTELGVLDERWRKWEINANLAAIVAAGEMGIEYVILHAGWGHTNENIHQKKTDATLAGMKELNRCAVEHHVKLAVENLQGAPSRQLTERILQEFPQEHIGFCHDTGHEHCTQDCFKALASMGGRLFCTHVHDNDGRGNDDHLLPYEGTIDWDLYAEHMGRLRYSGCLLLESVRNRADGFADSAAFLAEAKTRVVRLIAAIAQTKQ